MKSNLMVWGRNIAESSAASERRRIRRVQAKALATLRLGLGGFATVERVTEAMKQLDAATRAPKRSK